MRVAFCLYGQPRLYLEGFKHIDDFVKKNSEVTFDFFYHMWFDSSQEYYDCSKYRHITNDELRIDSHIIDRVYALYKPKAYKVEEPIVFDTTLLQKSSLYSNSNGFLQQNVQNTLSQLCSKQRIRDIVESYCRETDKYDLVISSRFDFRQQIEIDLCSIDPSKVYVNNIHSPRYTINDSFFICSPQIFYTLFNAFQEIPSIMSDQELQDKLMQSYNEVFHLTTESIFFAVLAKYYDIVNVVIYTNKIPNFI